MSAGESASAQEVRTLYSEQHGWLRRRLGDAHQAADLAHDACVRLLARDEPVQARWIATQTHGNSFFGDPHHVMFTLKYTPKL